MFNNIIFLNNDDFVLTYKGLINLSEDSIHFWSFDINNLKQHSLHFYNVLSESEKSRSNRFQFEDHRVRYTLTHGILRYLLAYYTSSEPEKVKISVSDKGKPAILSNMYNIYFNISHSENLIVIAICKGKEIGVDIEIIRTDRNIASISKHYFNYNEKVNFENIEDSLKLLYFYYLWTFKEALLKAQGVGLTASIKDICLILREPDLHKMFYEGKYNFNCEDFVFSIFKLTGCFVSSLAVKI